MAGKTCRISQFGKEKIEEAIVLDGRSKTVVAQAASISRDTLYKILNRSTVRFTSLTSLCFELGLEADELLEADETISDDEIKRRVKQLRKHIEPEIHKRCGLMRVLDMTQPIDSTAIYTDVNILERITSKSRADLAQLVQRINPEHFNRFGLGQVREKRVPGLAALARYRLMMILGKPGAGKTTFLKRLAMWCKAGQQGLEVKIPVFITLKEFADDHQKYITLIDFVLKSYELHSLEKYFKQLLEVGRILILLDGLDEVQSTANERVLTAIREFSRKYDRNQIVITCRISAREYIFEQFTEVEVADFHDEQIKDFANKWFLSHNSDQINQSGQSTIGQLFWQELEQNPPVRELATNPLLLTLLCLEFGEDFGFPSSRAELYERGLDILFTKWDGTRQIKRDQVYKKLPIKRKKNLLGQLAWKTLTKGNYFFKQSIAEKHIQQYIQNLPGVSEDEEALLLSSTAVLKSIEAQHGLLTQRAKGIYSFSHLTFQEYFSAACLANQPEYQSLLINRMHEQHMKEVFLLSMEKLDDADNFISNMFRTNNEIIKRNSLVESFLKFQNLKKRMG